MNCHFFYSSLLTLYYSFLQMVECNVHVKKMEEELSEKNRLLVTAK